MRKAVLSDGWSASTTKHLAVALEVSVRLVQGSFESSVLSAGISGRDSNERYLGQSAVFLGSVPGINRVAASGAGLSRQREPSAH